MENNITIPKPTAKNISAVMIHADNANRESYNSALKEVEYCKQISDPTVADNLPKWIKKVFEIAKIHFNHTEDHNTRKRENTEMRRAIFAVSYQKWKPYYSQGRIAQEISIAVNRKKHFQHCDLINHVNKHNEFIKFPVANPEYVKTFEKFNFEVLIRGLL